MDDNETGLASRVAALEQWQKERQAQQIVFPLDINSQNILAPYFMHINSLINYEVVGAASHTVFLYLGTQGSQNFEISQQTIFPYTVNTISNVFTSTSNSFINGTQVSVFCTATGSFPAPLAINTTYFVINSTGATFQLSATSGGSAIDITTAGVGAQYIQANEF